MSLVDEKVLVGIYMPRSLLEELSEYCVKEGMLTRTGKPKLSLAVTKLLQKALKDDCNA